jgi:hypothetical protein
MIASVAPHCGCAVVWLAATMFIVYLAVPRDAAHRRPAAGEETPIVRARLGLDRPSSVRTLPRSTGDPAVIHHAESVVSIVARDIPASASLALGGATPGC